MRCLKINIDSNYGKLNYTKESNNLKFKINMLCDIDYGIPLYNEDGSIYTFEGLPVYVRSVKTKYYE